MLGFAFYGSEIWFWALSFKKICWLLVWLLVRGDTSVHFRLHTHIHFHFHFWVGGHTATPICIYDEVAATFVVGAGAGVGVGGADVGHGDDTDACARV